MRTITMTLCAILASVTTIFAASHTTFADDKPISFDQLPAKAQSFINKYFAGEEVSHITYDRDALSADYDVRFLSGTEVEFDSNGEWKDIDTRNGVVPAELIPQAIAKYVKSNYPNRTITEISRNHTHTEVTLNGGLELKFNKNHKLVEVDD